MTRSLTTKEVGDTQECVLNVHTFIHLLPVLFSKRGKQCVCLYYMSQIQIGHIWPFWENEEKLFKLFNTCNINLYYF